MSAWRFRRQLTVSLIFAAIIIFPTIFFIYIKTPSPTCFDGKKNQLELGIDCGGPCVEVCEGEVAELVVSWSRIFKVREGEYDLAALIENPNAKFAAESYTFKFEVYNKNSEIIYTEEGIGYSNPREVFVLFEPKVLISGEEPHKVFLEIGDIKWVRVPSYNKEQILVKDETLKLEPTPVLSATLINELVDDTGRIETIGIVYNDEDNAIAVSRSIVNNVPSGGSQKVFFTWPAEFKDPPRICVNPIKSMLVFDTSGSMNDDGDNPPQPLTDAKNAAKVFVNNLSSRDEIGLVTFATEATFPVDQSLTTDLALVKDAISGITIDPKEETGYTNLGDGLDKAIKELSFDPGDEDTKEVIVVLTDGLANYPLSPGGEEYAEEKALDAKLNDFEIFAIGLGGGVNSEFLENKVSYTPAHYFFSATSGDLKEIYTQIAKDVCPEKIYLTSVFVRFIDGVE